MTDRRHPQGAFSAFGRVVDACESYVERRLAVAFLFSEMFTFEPYGAGADTIVARDSLGIILSQQARVGGYRIDFTLTHDRSAFRLAIDLDGHAFHERTPSQSERDKSRDRALLASGWHVVRFAGREVVRDAMRCAQEAHRLMAANVPELGADPRPETLPAIAKAAPISDEEWERQVARAREVEARVRSARGLPAKAASR